MATAQGITGSKEAAIIARIVHLRAITIIDNGLIKIIDGNFRSRSKYRWPLLSSAGCDSGSLAFASA